MQSNTEFSDWDGPSSDEDSSDGFSESSDSSGSKTYSLRRLCRRGPSPEDHLRDFAGPQQVPPPRIRAMDESENEEDRAYAIANGAGLDYVSIDEDDDHALRYVRALIDDYNQLHSRRLDQTRWRIEDYDDGVKVCISQLSCPRLRRKWLNRACCPFTQADSSTFSPLHRMLRVNTACTVISGV